LSQKKAGELGSSSLAFFLTMFGSLGLLAGLPPVVEISAHDVRELCLAGGVGEGLGRGGGRRHALPEQLGHQHLGHGVRVTLLIPVCSERP
jgi:hypothetical protein